MSISQGNRASNISSDFSSLKPSKNWSFSNVDRSEMFDQTHAYHRYPAKFVPHMVSQIIVKYSQTSHDVICDPFGGCGTTLVESKLAGHESIGFDINPVATLIARTKTKPINPIRLARYNQELFARLKGRPKKARHYPSRVYYWFEKQAVNELDHIYQAIVKADDPTIKRFYLCCFSHILKNSSRWLMRSIKPTIDKSKVLPDTMKSFGRHIEFMTNRNTTFFETLKSLGSIRVPARMRTCDTKRHIPLDGQSIDLVITSPPYVTSYAYADLHQLSLLWFSSDPTNFPGWNNYLDCYSEFRRSFIGASNKIRSALITGSCIADSISRRLSAIDERLSRDVGQYFADMNRVFGEIHRITRPGGKACVVVGNTVMKGVRINNAQVAAEQLMNHGFQKVEYAKRELTQKSIAPWRDCVTGKFTGLDNPARKSAYRYEYVLVMERHNV